VSPEALVGDVGDLISTISRDGRPVVRMRCTDYGHEYVVECDVYPVNELSVQPKIAGPYVFPSRDEARVFVDTSLLALQALGCQVG
jgi:hypothetical protein